MEIDIERLSRQHIEKKTPLPPSVSALNPPPPLQNPPPSPTSSVVHNLQESLKLNVVDDSKINRQQQQLEASFVESVYFNEDPTNKPWKAQYVIHTNYHETLFANAHGLVLASVPAPAPAPAPVPTPTLPIITKSGDFVSYSWATPRLDDLSKKQNQLTNHDKTEVKTKTRNKYQIVPVIDTTTKLVVDTTKLVVVKNLYQCKICPHFYLCQDCKSKTNHPKRHEFYEVKQCKSTINCDKCSIWNTNLDIREKMFKCTSALRYSGQMGTKPSPIQWCLWSQSPEMRHLTYKLFRSLPSIFESKITFNEDAFFKDIGPETRNDLSKVLIELAAAIKDGVAPR